MFARPDPTRLSSAARIAVLATLLLATAPAARARPATDVCQLTGDTTWTAALSPYRSTCDVLVAAGRTLTIEPGVTVQLGSGHSLKVAGRLMAVGTAEQPIVFEPAVANQSWAAVQLEAGSGPSQIAHARFGGGGARRAEMLGLATSDAVVQSCEFGTTGGVAVEIRGASPTVRDSRFVKAVDPGAMPPAALRVVGAGDPVITGNLFQSNNQYGMSLDLTANPRLAGNRFQFNAFDGILVQGTATRAITWPSLGPRAWAYQVNRSPLVVDTGGSLTIGAGATLRFASGMGLRVNGTLRVEGAASQPVLISTNAPSPRGGTWREIWFTPGSVDYDPATGQGSLIDHALIEYGSSQSNGQVWIQGASPRIANTLFRQGGQRGLVVTGADARPELIGLTVMDHVVDPAGIGLLAQNGAAPVVTWSLFTKNRQGVRSESGATPRIGPNNRFDGNTTYAVYNDDREVCLDATLNDWGATSGPYDSSDRADACNGGKNEGQGGLVTDHVRYSPWAGTFTPRPSVTAPQCGLQASDRPTIQGWAPAGAEVDVYDNHRLLGTTTAGPGEDEGAWSYTPGAPLSPGSHVLQALARRGTQVGAVSNALELAIDPDQLIQPAGIQVDYTLEGTHYVQPYQDAAGCLTLAGDWPIRPLSGVPVTLRLPVSCPGGATPTGAVLYRGAELPLAMGGDGRLGATFDQADGGAVALRLTCGTLTDELLLGTLAPEYDGLVYDEPKGLLSRVKDATVTLYVNNRSNRQWVPWDGAAYHGQANPVTTGPSGRFAFYPPPGLYRVKVEAAGYTPQFGPSLPLTIEPYVAMVGLAPLGGKGIYLPITRRDGG